jgi:hypothetical protein
MMSAMKKNKGDRKGKIFLDWRGVYAHSITESDQNSHNLTKDMKQPRERAFWTEQ